MREKGKFYGVSVGPGDPELITLKAVRIINECEVIATPKTRGEKTLALDIASKAVDFTNKTVVEFEFSMTKDKEKLEKIHSDIADKIAKILNDGKNVAMLNLGDVSIYSTFSYIQEKIMNMGFESEMISGVPSFCAVASRLNISLTTMKKPLHIIPAVHSDIENYINMEGTKVLMKTASSFKEVKEKLCEYNVASKTMMIQNCGLKDEKICKDLSENKDDKISYFTTIIIKD